MRNWIDRTTLGLRSAMSLAFAGIHLQIVEFWGAKGQVDRGAETRTEHAYEVVPRKMEFVFADAGALEIVGVFEIEERFSIQAGPGPG